MKHVCVERELDPDLNLNRFGKLSMHLSVQALSYCDFLRKLNGIYTYCNYQKIYMSNKILSNIKPSIGFNWDGLTWIWLKLSTEITVLMKPSLVSCTIQKLKGTGMLRLNNYSEPELQFPSSKKVYLIVMAMIVITDHYTDAYFKVFARLCLSKCQLL